MAQPNCVVLMVVGDRVGLAQLGRVAVREHAPAYQIVLGEFVEVTDVVSTPAEDALLHSPVSMDNVLDRPFQIVQEEFVEVMELGVFVDFVPLGRNVETVSAFVHMIAMTKTVEMLSNLLEQASLSALLDLVEHALQGINVEVLVCAQRHKAVT